MTLVFSICAAVALVVLFLYWIGAAVLRGQARCLAALGEAGDWIQGRDISSLANVSRGAVYTHLSDLEDEGLIECAIRPGGPERGHRPRYFYKITVEGQIALEEIAKRKELQ